MKLSGKVSHFGGPEDTGVSAQEDLALYWEDEQVAEHPELFLDGASTENGGLARQLNPEAPYLAVRWSYEGYEKSELRDAIFVIYAPDTDRSFLCRAVDWGPAGPESDHDTGRIADISPGLMEALGIITDDEVTIIGPVLDIERELPERPTRPQPVEGMRIALSSGHGAKISGAVGLIDEHTEAVDVVEEVARQLKRLGCTVWTFEDTTSTDQDTNLATICAWHNSLPEHDYDVSVHFNSSDDKTTDKCIGCEVWYLSQKQLASDLSAAMAKAGGLKNRGPKYTDDLYVINHCAAPTVLLEVAFVNSRCDIEDCYVPRFDEICAAIADVLSGGSVPMV